ncbi:hypothetical protein TUM20983_55030 [Mycobacterium antarcticum]|uniref:DUF6286 domain-containing protein n=1 Tax=unclassified Mycolicibacterium TaxID=2636767 RepID=UPI002390B4B0|nr:MULTISPECIES: DUF6286 domain-containing protein [unclassified Mycolicibacterium]GLP78393.1 hypothetical protein TUM20983_55030 [Mycolicibacterium sp. TUM20983]GLP81446.1 hypothetical protein TUM20984_28660 [Mycolicibacterium sp. TUM20984]
MTTPSETASATDRRPARLPAAGRAPVAAPSAGYVGTVIALVLLGAGIVALRDTAVLAGWLDGQPFTTTAIEGIDGLTVSWWTSPVGILAILIGAWWVYAALRPRRRTAIPVAADTSVWISPANLARIASAAAQSVPGVLDARSSAGLRKIVVTAQTTSDEDVSKDGKQIKKAIAEAVGDTVNDFLATPLKVSVRTRTGGR